MISVVYPFCNAIQGDWYLREESIELISSGFSLAAQAAVFGFFNDEKLLLFKEGEFILEYPNISMFRHNYKKDTEPKLGINVDH